MERSPEVATSGAGGGHGFPWHAAGAILVALTFLIGVGMVVTSATIAAPDQPLRPPQPEPAAAPPALLPSVPADARAGSGDAGSADAGSPDSGSAESDSGDSGSGDAGSADAGSGDLDGSALFPVGMARSAPTRVRVPRIGVDAEVIRVGVDKEGQIEVPALEEAHLAGWYGPGPSPGEIGSAVVVGHVDSYAMGPAVFFELGALRPGDRIEVARKDGSVAEFIVDGVASYPKDEFPTSLVYGSSGRAELRLVTCGGVFDTGAREYEDNVIVFASLDPESVPELAG